MHSTKDRLPKNNTYVLARYNRGNWRDSHDQEGCQWLVVKFVRGMSIKERTEALMTKRALTYKPEDEFGNNRVPYCWKEFGHATIFGQDIDVWADLPIRNITK